MPRNVKESDDEVETKGARRTRAALNSSALDSPLRRSTRIKPPANQDHSSPESVSDVTSVSAPKNTRRRTTTGETAILEAARITRGRRNSTASDISELTETESLPEGPAKRITRRSVAGTSLADTPTMLNGRTRRATRAGSETKSTPPVGRPVRRTRASSMEPETIDETKNRHVGTPVKSRKRASVMPSEPAVAEESEDGRSADVAKNVEKTVYETNEDETETSTHNTSASLRQKPEVDGNESDEKMEVDDSPVKETAGDTIESTEDPTDISGVSRKLEDSIKIADSHDDNVAPDKTSKLEEASSLSKSSSHTMETTANNSVEKEDKSLRNKENEVSNSADVSIDRDDKLFDNEARLFHKKIFKSSLAKIAGKRRSVSTDDNICESKIATKNQEIEGKESPRRASETLRKGHLVDECVVVIEPMDISQVDKVIVAQTSVVSKPKSEDDRVQESESNPPLVEQQKPDEAAEKESTKNKEDSTNDGNIVDGDSDLKISNVVSMAPEEEPKKKDDQRTVETRAETIQVNETIETIDLESSVVEDADTGKNLSTVAAKPIDSQSSIINENPKTNEETEEIVVFDVVKGKSSIVTESPVSGTNAEEATGSIEEPNNDMSLPNGGSPAPISEKLGEDVEPESLKKKNETERKGAESDDDSEYSGYPAFKDIPADEWLGGDAEGTKKQTADETNSVHSASTERNESECEIELVDKEALPVGEKYEYKREEKFDYDTDDTVITQVVSATRETEDKRSEEKAVVDEVTPMDVSSDPDEDGDVACKSSKESPKKRLSLATPRKSIGANASLKNKNDSIACVMDVESTNSEPPTKDDANVSVKSVRSSSKSPKKRSSLSAGRPKNDDSSDSDEDAENSEAKTTRAGSMANRKSLEASAKKLNVSAKSRDSSKIEIETSESPKRRRSSNRFVRLYNFDNSDDELDDAEDKNKSQSSSESGAKQSGINDTETKLTTLKQGKSRLSGIKATDGNSSSTLTEDTQSSPLIAKEQSDRSLKTGSARKSMSNRNTSKITDSNSDSEIDAEDSLSKTEKSSAPERARTNMNDSPAAQDSSDSDIEGDNAKDDSASPKIDGENLNGSAKLGSARKSATHKESLNGSARQGSARKSAIHDENLNGSAKQTSARKSAIHDESLNRSSKQGSAKKSAIERNNSKVASVSSDSEAEFNDSKKSPESSENVSRALKSSLIDTDSEPDEAETRPKVAKSKIGNAKKLLIDEKNYSTIAQVNSDSEVVESSSSDEDNSSMIPQFFFDQDSTSSSSTVESDDSSDTIDSDVARDLNLHGRSVLEYSDDDVPADDCMATESESSDSDDDGADLLDFVVEDDEECDSFEDVAMELGAEENDDSSDSERKKPRRRIITRPGGDSDSDDIDEENALDEIDSDVAESTTAKTPKRDKKPSKPDVAEAQSDLNLSSRAAAKRNKNILLQSSTPRVSIAGRLSFDKTDSPKAPTPLSKSLKNAESSTRGQTSQTPLGKKLSKSVCETEETPSKLGSSFKVAKTPTPMSKSLKNADTSTKMETSQTSSAKKLSKSVCETEDTPTKLGSSFKVAKTPTSLSKSLKNADTSTNFETSQTSSAKKLSKSVCETEDTPTKLGSSFKVAKSPTRLSKSLKNADSSTNFETSQTSSAKKLSKSVCETEDTPTKLGSSFRVAKSPKTPGSMAQQLQTSLPADFVPSTKETNLSKTKSTKLSALNQTMAAPSSESPETRFLMKEKLNDSLPALKLQQRARASRRSTLDNLREIPSTDEQLEDAAAENASVESEVATVEPEVDNSEIKRKKKKAAKNTSIDSKSLGTSMEVEGVSIDNESCEFPAVDAPRDISKKRDKKKKKLAEMETEELTEAKNENSPTKDKKKKKKKLDENIEEVQVNEPNKKDKKKRKKLDGTVDEVESIETSERNKKKKKRAETVEEVETVEISKKDKKKKKREETVDEVESIEIVKKDKKKKKRAETVDEDVVEELAKKHKNRKEELAVETAEAPKKKSLRGAAKNGDRDSSNDLDNLSETVEDAKSKRQQRKVQTRLTSNAVETSKTTLKRLPDEVLESLADTAARPSKRRKISKAEKILPSRTMFDGSHQSTASIKIDDGFIPLSASGGTTQFAVVNLEKAAKKSKRSVAAGSFRDRMLARNNRQPISAYLMYKQKQKASGKDRPY